MKGGCIENIQFKELEGVVNSLYKNFGVQFSYENSKANFIDEG